MAAGCAADVGAAVPWELVAVALVGLVLVPTELVPAALVTVAPGAGGFAAALVGCGGGAAVGGALGAVHAAAKSARHTMAQRANGRIIRPLVFLSVYPALRNPQGLLISLSQ